VPAATYSVLKHPGEFVRAVLVAVNTGDAADSIAALIRGVAGAVARLKVIPGVDFVSQESRR
jgi:ADP-ribosylglycohydrolase